MTIVEHGEVHDGRIVLSQPVALPEGTRVIVAITQVDSTTRKPTPEEIEEVTSMPFFGMWADREDMKDSVTWVRRQREQWLDRLNSRD